jgi:hypothetical protein
MRTFTKMAAVLLVAVTFTINAGDHGYEVKDGQNDRLMDLVGASDERYMMIVQIAKNPELRFEMMQKIMHSMRKDTGMDMHKVLNDPEMKARMQRHIGMMQELFDSEEMNQATMKEMMDNPEMKSMMKMHILFAQITNGQ